MITQRQRHCCRCVNSLRTALSRSRSSSPRVLLRTISLCPLSIFRLHLFSLLRASSFFVFFPASLFVLVHSLLCQCCSTSVFVPFPFFVPSPFFIFAPYPFIFVPSPFVIFVPSPFFCVLPPLVAFVLPPSFIPCPLPPTSPPRPKPPPSKRIRPLTPTKRTITKSERPVDQDGLGQRRRDPGARREGSPSARRESDATSVTARASRADSEHLVSGE